MEPANVKQFHGYYTPVENAVVQLFLTEKIERNSSLAGYTCDGAALALERRDGFHVVSLRKHVD